MNFIQQIKQIQESDRLINNIAAALSESYTDYVVRYRVFSKNGNGPVVTKEKSFATAEQMEKWCATAEDKVPYFYEIVSHSGPQD